MKTEGRRKRVRMKHLYSLSDRLEDLLEDFLIDVVELDVTYYYMWMWSRQEGKNTV